MSRHRATLTRPAAGEISSTREYYRRILPFYEKESLARAHLAFWRAIASEARPGRILEIGAGLGRITSALAGVAPAIGLDVCLEMLSIASLRPGQARFVAADARRAVFAPCFDLIVAPGDPISHMTRAGDRKLALSAIAAQLSRGGIFVLEGLHRRRNEVVLHPRRTIRHAGGSLAIEEAWFPVGDGDLWHARYHYTDRREDGTVRTLDAAFVARAWDPAKLGRLFADCGLEIAALWGGFDRHPFRRDSPRIVAVAHKRGARETAEARVVLARILRQ
jgi:SAM-dependent methyltransferase